VQLYSLRSSRNWGIGDFRDLMALVVAASRRGIDVIGLNPLHALFPARPTLCSPYSPASRQFLNTLYIAPESIPEYDQCDLARAIVAGKNFQATLERLRESKLVDYEAVSRCKDEILRLLFAEFEKDPFSERQSKFDVYSRKLGQALENLAIYYAIDHEQCTAGRRGGWRNWDAAYQDPDSAAVAEFAESHDGDIRYYKYLQWITSQQLAAVESAAKSAGMTIGCYRDLAVGVDGAGPDTWMDQALYVSGVNIGAPPDALAADGQDWCMPPMNPRVMHERAYQPFIDLLRANMVEGGALRMDHVMALQRMWWVPDGLRASDGVYVKNYLNDLMAIVALESQRCRCLVIGEDLGTVPQEIRQSMRDIGMYSYKVMVFELDETGRCRKPGDYPTRSVVTVTTHDMPPIAGVWSESDIKARQRIGFLAEGKPASNVINVRRTEKRRILEALQRECPRKEQGVQHDDVMNSLRPEILDAIQMYAARSSASLMLVRAEEWLGEEEPFNLPGTDQEYPNWRRKLDVDLVSFLDEPQCMQWCTQITSARHRDDSTQ